MFIFNKLPSLSCFLIGPMLDSAQNSGEALVAGGGAAPVARHGHITRFGSRSLTTVASGGMPHPFVRPDGQLDRPQGRATTGITPSELGEGPEVLGWPRSVVLPRKLIRYLRQRLTRILRLSSAMVIFQKRQLAGGESNLPTT